MPSKCAQGRSSHTRSVPLVAHLHTPLRKCSKHSPHAVHTEAGTMETREGRPHSASNARSRLLITNLQHIIHITPCMHSEQSILTMHPNSHNMVHIDSKLSLSRHQHQMLPLDSVLQ